LADRALHVFIRGRVQGVNFRATAQNNARALGLTGWVRNLPDGRVEAHFEGGEDQLKEMLDWCGQGPSLAAVDDVETSWVTPEGHDSFQVRG